MSGERLTPTREEVERPATPYIVAPRDSVMMICTLKGCQPYIPGHWPRGIRVAFSQKGGGGMIAQPGRYGWHGELQPHEIAARQAQIDAWEADKAARHAANEAEIARMYPGFRLLPAPPAWAISCKECRGIGQTQELGNDESSGHPEICNRCMGTGWV